MANLLTDLWTDLLEIWGHRQSFLLIITILIATFLALVTPPFDRAMRKLAVWTVLRACSEAEAIAQ